MIAVEDLVKIYTRPSKDPGLRGTLRHLFRPRVEAVHALNGVSFQVEPGEILGYVGPNGAGKTTTLKVLAGVLYPTSGSVTVLGFVPWRREKAFLREITFVMSGRGFLEEMAWDLTLLDGLEFVRAIYGVKERAYEKSLEELVELLGLGELLHSPVRQLSHGQRAKAELAGALLWRPRVMLLDEPTLGLDVVAQDDLRKFIRAYVKAHNAACIVTSHYMRDIEELADRLLLLDRGRIVAEGSPLEIVERLSAHRLIQLEFERAVPLSELTGLGRVIEDHGLKATLEVPRSQAKDVARRLLEGWPVRDLTIEEPSLEEVLQRYFSS